MEQTLTIATDLAQLPEILTANQSLCERAVAGMRIELPTNFAKLQVVAGDEIEAKVNDLRTRAADAIKLNKERRMPFTKRMDEVKSLFTAAENAIAAEADRLKKWADEWNAEKGRRVVETQRQNELKLARDNAKFDFAKHITEQLNAFYTRIVSDSMSRMNAKFYDQNETTIAEYAAQLQAWIPKFDVLSVKYGHEVHPLLTGEEIAEIKTKIEAEHIPIMESEYVATLRAERDRLIALVPARIEELKRIANDAEAAKAAQKRIEKEKAERAAELAKQEAERAAAAESEANANKMANAFEQAAIAPAVHVSAGTVQKKKYAPASHKEFIPVIQWWVANAMALMTVDELNKKLSFMLTAANKALNDGTKIEGVPVVDDYSTRTKRSIVK